MLPQQVEVRRTSYGVPHILAENVEAAGYGMGYVQMEDYGPRVVHGLIRARGELGLHFGRDSIVSDFEHRRTYALALRTFGLLEQDTRDMMEGFAAGVNRYITLYPDEFPDFVRPDFTGRNVHAFGVRNSGPPSAREFLNRMEVEATARAEPPSDPEDGSNAWAIGPGRTESGSPILLRNPHLSWDAGYYEAQVTVPGVVNFYGDFRLGGPLGIVGGFNEDLGWATTNNNPDLDEIYALRADPARPDHYLFGGRSVPLKSERVTVGYRTDKGIARETRTYWSSEIGQVIHRDHENVYVIRYAGDGVYRMDEQFLLMMKAKNLEEWKDAVRIRARTSSNLTYADDDGNIFYVWNATIPVLPHESGGDTTAIHVDNPSEVWSRIVPFDSLPQLLNPEGGYVRNENDSPHFTNLNEPLLPAELPANVPEPRLRLRSQHSLELLHETGKVSLEEVVEMKHSVRMLLADRVKADLVNAVKATQPSPEIARAIAFLEKWDNTVAAESRGGVLFQIWWERYENTAPQVRSSSASAGFSAPADALFEVPWSTARPTSTPHGLADPQRAAAAFAWAVEETQQRYGSWDVAWGEVHRVRRGDVDVPVGGCGGLLGCFRVLSFDEAEDGKRVAVGGDGWVLAVAFTDPPRAYSVLAYGESDQPDSPYFDNQAALFANNQMKPVAFTEEEIQEQLIRRYHPGATDQAAGIGRLPLR